MESVPGRAIQGDSWAASRKTNATVPYRRGNHSYYSSTEKGKQYPIQLAARPPGRMSPRRSAVSMPWPWAIPSSPRRLCRKRDDGNRLAYTLDYNGFREYTLS